MDRQLFSVGEEVVIQIPDNPELKFNGETALVMTAEYGPRRSVITGRRGVCWAYLLDIDPREFSQSSLRKYIPPEDKVDFTDMMNRIRVAAYIY